jgi:hypothetical protein
LFLAAALFRRHRNDAFISSHVRESHWASSAKTRCAGANVLAMKTTRLLLLLTPFLLCACSELNEANYSRLEVGMPFEEVRGIFGAPKECDEGLGLRSCRWGDESRWVRVSFVADRVAVTAAKNLKWSGR